MAFTLPVELNGEAYSAAYIKAHIKHCDSDYTVLALTVWTSQDSRTSGGQPVPASWLPSSIKQLMRFPTNLELVIDNPIDYAYTLLEQSGEFPEATWNV